MPDEDGWEILMRLKSDPKSEDIPVIICSVLNEPQLGRALGAVDYLTKPVSQQALLQALAPWGQRRDIVTPVPPA
jgi:Amt family ammonium transporter